MGLNIQNSNYNGEVLEQLLTLAATGNELVEKGLIRVEPNIGYKFSIPRLKSGTMLQKRKEQPSDSDSKGDFDYSERVLKPEEFMAFTTFNPRSFERVWRKWQPKGPLVFAQLPAEAQNALLAELAKQVKFELGDHFINGVYEEGTDDDKLFNGIIYRMEHAENKIVVNTDQTTMIGKLKALKARIPQTMRSNPDLCIIMSVTDFDQYDDELSAQQSKGADYTDMNPERFKGIAISPLSLWPDGLIVATIASPEVTSNLWAGVDFLDDENVIQIDKLTNAGEKYFFKMLLKADTCIAFDEEVVWLDHRDYEGPVITGAELIDDFAATSGSKQRTYATSNGEPVTAQSNADWITATVGSDGHKVTFAVTAYAHAESGDDPRVGTVTLAIAGTSATKTVTIKQAMAEE
ncbi:MAG: BACON domain-containing protein [Bacteroidales bacterium]|nr:BACON domain-containing protein [Candidatus Cryptobacteroides equifaecalis]